MLTNFHKSVVEELKLLFKGKMLLVVIIFIPLLTNLLIGYEFNKGQIQNIPMAIYDQDNSSISRMITQQFIENPVFDVKYFPSNSLDLKGLIDQSKVRAGMIIPKDFGMDILNTKSPTLLMLYDGSHMPIAAAAKSKASEILLTLKTGILIKSLEARLNLPSDMAEKIALAIKFENRVLYNPTKNYKNFLNIGIGTAIIQSAIALMTAVAIKRTRLPRGFSKRFSYYFGKLSFYSLLGWISLMINILFVQINMFHIPFRGQLLDVAILSALFSLAVSSFGIMTSIWIKDEMIATILNAILFVPNTIMVGYTWPTISMPAPYKAAASFYPFYHYSSNLRDFFLKGLILDQVKGDILWLLCFTGITMAVSAAGLLILKSPKNDNITCAEEGENIALS